MSLNKTVLQLALALPHRQRSIHKTMDWLIAAIGLALVALIITITVLMMRHRKQMRAAAREAESLNVVPNHTRRAFWYSSADHSDPSDSSSSGGGGDGGD